MTIRTIETVVEIAEDRKLILQLPPDVPLGKHRVVAALDEATNGPAPSPRNGVSAFPIVNEAQWPADMPLTREDM